MIDETFHLTPLDVRRYDFGRALRGYDPDRVDQFREQVAEELERLTRLNQDLDSKAKNFHEQLRAFRERDKALNEALVSAQQLRSEIREQSERESQLVLREARAAADRILEQARLDIRSLQDELASLDRTRRSYLAQLRLMAERQLAEINAAETSSPKVTKAEPAPPAAPKPAPQGAAPAAPAAASAASAPKPTAPPAPSAPEAARGTSANGATEAAGRAPARPTDKPLSGTRERE